MTRTRTHSWTDPAELARLARTMSGLDFLRHLMLAGEQARIPMASTLPFRITEVEPGRVVFVGDTAGPIHAVGTAVNRGRRSGLATVELRYGDDRLLVHGTSSCLLFDLEG